MQQMRVVVVLSLLCAANAQRYVVDAGGGGNFLDLPQAVAAVPDGATLFVRPGIYTQFTVQGKGLTIVGTRAGCVVGPFPPTSTPVDIVGLPSGKRVVISGFTFGFPGGTPFRILNCAGAVILDSVNAFGPG